jgi:hypothetical protein
MVHVPTLPTTCHRRQKPAKTSVFESFCGHLCVIDVLLGSG